MELVIDKKVLIGAMAMPARLTSPKRPTPILGCMLLEAHASGDVDVTGTDIYRRATGRAAAKEVVRAGRCAADGRLLAAIVSRLPDSGPVRLASSGDSLTVSSGRAKHRVPTRDPDDFPPAPEHLGEPAEIPLDVFRDAMGVRYAASTDNARPHMSGTWLVSDGERLSAFASDGHRIAAYEAATPGRVEVLVPLAALGDLAALSEAATSPVSVQAKAGSYAWWSADIECGRLTYAHSTTHDRPYLWRQVVPAHRDAITMQREALLAAVRRAELAASEKGDGILIQAAPGELRVSASNADRGEAADAVEAEGAAEGPRIGICASYLREALASHVDDTIALGLGDELDAITIRSTARTSVIMPMRTT